MQTAPAAVRAWHVKVGIERKGKKRKERKERKKRKETRNYLVSATRNPQTTAPFNFSESLYFYRSHYH
jgi:hypothetical protein